MMDKEMPDLLYGLDAIAGHLGVTSRQVKHRALTGRIPTFKIERTVCARRSTLNAWLVEQEARALRRRLEPEPEPAVVVPEPIVVDIGPVRRKPGRPPGRRAGLRAAA